MISLKKYFHPLTLVLLVLALWGCSKPGGTKTSVKLNVTGISALSATAGSGGTMLFGRSTNGDMFGKIINGTEEILDVPNGDWIFYALMWDTNSSGLPLNDKVFCSKMPAKLGGTDLSLTFNLSNSNCTDPDFSNGKFYTSGGLVRFADLFVEECDDVNASTNWFCGAGNQGSALSYRLKFQNFKKPGAGGFLFGPEAITSACKKIDTVDGTDVMKQGLPVNFPGGNGTAPFVVSIEMFLGTSTCDTTDAKGVHTAVLQNGLASPAAFPAKVLVSTTNCSFSTPDFPVDLKEKQNLCESWYGNWTGSSCTVIPLGISRFAPTCSSQTPGVTPAIKHLISIPKPALCDKYNGSNAVIGSHPFSGGNGTIERPYKICNEWQMNQIGEKTAPATFAMSSYKLMNDLDMNRADLTGPYQKPLCSGVPGSIVDNHHNLNPLDRLTTDCTTFDTTTNFQGRFNGNGRVIRNVRIQSKNAYKLGFVKKLTASGRIHNLTFKEMEVRGVDYIGGIAGYVDGSTDISNIVIEKLRAEGNGNNNTDGQYVGGIAGKIASVNTVLANVHVNNSEIRGRDYMGGLAGENYGKISKSHFRGTVSTDMSNGNTVGGLVGNNMSGAIVEHSFTEGLIASGAIATGGVAGSNSGSISSAYSTMAINGYYSTGSLQLGGIVGNNTSGSISNVFFDGVIDYSGGGTPTINGVYVLGSGGINCYTTHGAVPGGCSSLSLSSLRTTVPSFSVPADWLFTAGSVPRLAWETRPCLLSSNQQSVSAQIGTLGRGAPANPVIICHPDHLSAVSGQAATINYRIADDLNLGLWTLPTYTVSFLNGQLFGDEKILYGLNLTYVVGDTPNSYEGIFRSISNTGAIANLKLYNNYIINTAGLADLGTGILAGENQGAIAGIEMTYNKLDAEANVGLVAGRNSGIIKRAMVERGDLGGKNSVGGIAGFNTSAGSIQKSRSDVKITGLMGEFESFGGIVGSNAGSVDQVRFDGELWFGSATSAANGLRAGGIAGLNSGAISNAITDNRSIVKAADTHVVGGLVGENTGSSASLNLSLSLGKVVYSNAGAIGGANDDFHPLVGLVSGGTVGSYVYFLENKIASYRSSGQNVAACVGDGVTNCPNSPSPAGDVDSMDLQYGNGNTLKNLMPMIPGGPNFTYTGPALATNTQLDYFTSYTLTNITGKKTLAAIQALATYCPGGFTSGGPTGVCSGGFNIAEMGGAGNDRIIDYYLAMMNNQVPAANAPVWEFSTDEGPRLLQLED